MENIIAKFYHGNLDPYNTKFIKDSDYGKAMDIVEKSDEQLTELFQDNEKVTEIYTNLTNAWDDIIGLTGVESYVEGFRMGAKFVLDMLKE